jgi:hypothetical protein
VGDPAVPRGGSPDHPAGRGPRRRPHRLHPLRGAAGADGAWRDYYETFSWALQPASDPLYRITEDLQPLVEHSIEAHTFGKWNDDLVAITGPEPELLVCGVATDCCVLSTVLPAADAGASVTVVTDACAGSTDGAHQKALDVMALYQPLVSFTTTEELVAATVGH